MTGWHWLILAAEAVAVVLWSWWTWRRPRVRPFSVDEWFGPEADIAPNDRTAEVMFDAHASEALDVIAEPDRRRADHMNRTLRRVEGGDET